ncbi:MAG: YfhO family protein [Thermodesulfobacteriota bacterium]
MTETTTENNAGLKNHALAFIIYALLIAAFYSPVFFSSKSLLPSLYQPHGITASGLYGAKGRTPVNSFNVDLATPMYYEAPINKLVGDMYRAKKLPLWNPYQGAGTPLAAQYSTRVFFPYQIAEDIAPVWSWDYFILGRLLIAGFFTYLFIIAFGATPWSAFAGGLFYMFSGVFTWFINLEQLTNTAMMLPLLLFSIELLARGKPRARWVKVKIVFSAICFAFTLLAGQPQAALYVLTFTLLYYLFRVLTRHGISGGVKTIARIVIAFVTGLALTSPMILLFIELVKRGAFSPQIPVEMGLQKLNSWQELFNIITPTLSYFPSDPGGINGTSSLVKIGDNFFRYLPINGLWDNLGGYTGVLPLFLILAGIFISLLHRKIPLRLNFYFFIFISAFLLLKNIGIWPFILLSKVSMFDMVWTLRWASPVWVFSMAVAAALGLQLIEGHVRTSARGGEEGGKASIILPGVVFILAGGIIAGLYIIYSFVPSVGVFLHRADLFNDATSAFVLPSIIGGSLVTLIVIAAAFYLTFFFKGGKNVYAIIILAILELWWCLPRGYAVQTLHMKWIPLLIGLIAVFFYFRERFTYFFVALVVFLGASLLIDYMAPHGFPPRDDPFGTAPYVSAIMKDAEGGRPRVAGAYGALFANHASVIGLDDVRYVNSVTPVEFQAFREKYLHTETFGEFQGRPLWFTGLPARRGDDNQEGGDLSSRVKSLPENDFIGKERGYSMLGVGYFIFPGDYGGSDGDGVLRNNFEEKFPLIYSGEDAKVYKNTAASPRVYLATSTIRAKTWEEAQKVFMEGDFTPISTVVVDGDVELAPSIPGLDKKSAETPLDGENAAKTAVTEMRVSKKAVPEVVTAGTAMIKTPEEKKSGQEVSEQKAIELTASPVGTAELTLPASKDALVKAPDLENTEIAATLAGTAELRLPVDKAAADLANTELSAPVAATAELMLPSTDATDTTLTAPELTEEALNEEAAPLPPLNNNARIVEYSEGSVTVKVDSDRDAILVLGDLFYPGWRVKVNDEKGTLLRVNGLVRGVEVKAGRSTVVFYYLPLGFMIGLGILGVSVIFCLVLIFKDIKGDGDKEE